MFYITEAFLLEENLAYSKHSAVISAFGRKFAKTGRVPQAFHRYLIEGEETRNIGDYDTGPGLNRDQAEQIARAAKFIQLAKRSMTSAASKKKNKAAK